MFDFVNSTYSSILSVLSTLFGLSYPLILSCIEKLDTKFHSTKLSARFLEERVFIAFKVLLILNLMIAVVFPFFMDGNTHSRYLIAVQCIATVVMVFFAFLLFKMVMIYYDPGKLQEKILNDYNKAVKCCNKDQEAKYFTQWSDLTSVLLSSADEKLVQSVYKEWYAYVVRKYAECKGKPMEMDDYFYDAVTRINENLCKGERKPISVNNGNSLLTSLIVQDSIVTEKTYSYLWMNLRLQLYYNRDEWIMAYWKTASQRYDFFMQPISTFDIDEKTGVHYTDRQVEERERQRKKFQEFHIMLCAMLLQQNKYGLLEQMLFYTQSQPPSYPLVPSTLSSILQILKYLNEERLWDITYFESRYPMPNMHGITGGRILGAANCFLALLVYRLYVLDYPYGKDYVFRSMGLPDSQAELARYSGNLDVLKFWLGKIKNNREALAVIRLPNMDENQEDELVGKMDAKPKTLIEDIQKRIDEKLLQLKQNQPYDMDTVNTLEEEVSQRLSKALTPFNEIIGKRFGRATFYNLNSSISHLYPNSAFQANPDVGYGGISDCMFEGLWHTFSHLFASSFFQEQSQPDYVVDSGQLFDAFDRLKIGEIHFAIVFGIYIDYFMSKVDGLLKVNERLYCYKGMKLMLSDCPTPYFSKRVYIMRNEDRPYIEFQEPSDEQKETMALRRLNEYGLWMSVQKVEGHEDQLSEKSLHDLGKDKDLYSMFNAIWIPKLYFKENYKRICLKVNYRMTDEGIADSIDRIMPFDIEEVDTH